MGKRKGSKKRRRPEDEATSQARRRARTPIAHWSPLEEQPGPEQEEAGPSRLPVIQIPQVPRWADEDDYFVQYAFDLRVLAVAETTLSDYEKRRAANVARNAAFLASLDLPS